MKLKDLKQGMVCELRNGDTLTVSNNNEDIANVYYYKESEKRDFPFSANYNDDLTHQRQKDWDIIKVTFKIQKQESNLFFEPNKGEDYYYICDDRVNGYINDMKYDDAILKTNIVFKTKEEAVLELLRQQAKIRVIKEIARLNEGWDVRENWGSLDTMKYFINYNKRTGEFITDFCYYYKTLDNNLYLKTREIGKQLIETHSDDLKLMLEVER